VLVQAAKQLSETELRHFTSQFLALSQLAARQDVTLPALMRNPVDQLVLSFLGSFAVRLSGRPLKALGTDKTRALLAYLALEPPQAHA
jgi:hypothetical protein